jgi:hypothetical protein
MTAILKHKQLSQLSMLTDKILGNPLIDTSDDNVEHLINASVTRNSSYHFDPKSFIQNL